MEFAREAQVTPDQARNIEFVLQRHFCASPDFSEGVACAVGARKGETPAWTSATLETALSSPQIRNLKEVVKGLDLDADMAQLGAY